ncbi:Diphthamide biosynthesis protein 3, partial [Nowakowskiella sp. JEL0078]
VELEDMFFDSELNTYFWDCPCGDRFQITEVRHSHSNTSGDNKLTQEELRDGEDIARCPSCSLLLRVIYDPEDFCNFEEDDSYAVEPEAQIITA